MQGSQVWSLIRARMLEWVAISFSRRSSQPRDQTLISCIGRRVLYHWAASEAFSFSTVLIFLSLFFLSLPGVFSLTARPSLSCDTCSSSYLSHLSFRAFAQAGVPSSSASWRGWKAASSCEPWLGSRPCHGVLSGFTLEAAFSGRLPRCCRLKLWHPILFWRAFQVVQMVRNLPAMQEM